MFQFGRFPTYTYFIQCRLTEYCSAGFPHSEISGSMRMCRSPKLIAACRVLHRLLMPRHSPCALISLTSRKTVCHASPLHAAGLFPFPAVICARYLHTFFSSLRFPVQSAALIGLALPFLVLRYKILNHAGLRVLLSVSTLSFVVVLPISRTATAVLFKVPQ